MGCPIILGKRAGMNESAERSPIVSNGSPFPCQDFHTQGAYRGPEGVSRFRAVLKHLMGFQARLCLERSFRYKL